MKKWVYPIGGMPVEVEDDGTASAAFAQRDDDLPGTSHQLDASTPPSAPPTAPPVGKFVNYRGFRVCARPERDGTVYDVHVNLDGWQSDGSPFGIFTEAISRIDILADRPPPAPRPPGSPRPSLGEPRPDQKETVWKPQVRRSRGYAARIRDSMEEDTGYRTLSERIRAARNKSHE